MGQYTILMNNSTKQLIATHKINLRQHEVLVDKLVFIVPYQYNPEIDLRDFNVVVEWLGGDQDIYDYIMNNQYQDSIMSSIVSALQEIGYEVTAP